MVPGINSIAVDKDSGIHYVFEAPLPQVIGFSARLDLLHPGTRTPRFFSALHLNDDAEIFFARRQPGDGGGTRMQVHLRIAATIQMLGHVDLRPDAFAEVRIDWHTSGQARLFFDGRLVGYRNDMAPGTVIGVKHVQAGPMQVSPPLDTPFYHIRRLFVRALDRETALRHFVKLLPPIEPREDPGRCGARTAGAVLSMADRLRSFMAASHQILTRSWSEAAGPAAGPFEPRAVEAHRLAVEAAGALAGMLRRQDFEKPALFLEPFGAFLRILRDTQPQQFANLAAELGEIAVSRVRCRDEIVAVLAEQRQALRPVMRLLSEASALINRVAGGE